MNWKSMSSKKLVRKLQGALWQLPYSSTVLWFLLFFNNQLIKYNAFLYIYLNSLLLHVFNLVSVISWVICRPMPLKRRAAMWFDISLKDTRAVSLLNYNLHLKPSTVAFNSWHLKFSIGPFLFYNCKFCLHFSNRPWIIRNKKQ